MILFSRTFMRKPAISLATTATVAVPLGLAQDTSMDYCLRGAMPMQYVADRPDLADEQPFLSANDAAMNYMVAEMVIKPSGDVDRDFVAMMVPHHERAIAMARAELHYGRDDQLGCLARKIIAARRQEISKMQTAAGAELPAAPPAQASGASRGGGLKMNTRLQQEHADTVTRFCS